MQCVLHHPAAMQLKQFYEKREEPAHVPQGCDRTMLPKPDSVTLLKSPSIPTGISSDRQSRQSQLQSALKTFQNALTKAQANNDCASQILLLKQIGLIHCKLGEYAWGIKCLEQALQHAKAIGNQTSLGIILSHIGAAYHQTGQNYRALRVYLQALALFRDISDKASIARIFNRLGEIYNSLGQSERAISCCRQALKLFQDLGNSPDYEGAVLHNLGEAYLRLGRTRSAIALFEQALAICHKIHNYNGQATTLESIGTAYVKLNQDLRALEFYQKALEIRRVVGEFPNSEARTLDYIGAVYYKLGNYPLALCYHIQALSIWQTLNHTTSSMTLLCDKSDTERLLQYLVAVYECLDLHVQGEQCYQQALEIVTTFGDNPTEEAIWNYFNQEVAPESQVSESRSQNDLTDNGTWLQQQKKFF